ncbi:hypothetical protein OHA37_39100 [Streptomyces sp. NBC_00335]|uniref:hypothetical protein n=1 Tax=unclassified Streptomyces TaxID=2593676 RepID=UPI002253B19C|nr:MULTISPECIES: hypothetical protein [unclassified Streptomyces]MCX5409840.1 hypothetical protein [Streptomyces sp. NBC_00086]
MGVGIALLVFGTVSVGWGSVLLFNLRGTADKAAARRNTGRAVTAARTMDLSLTEPSQLGPWFFRLMGGFILPAGLALCLVGLVLTVEG